jgi:hypothetical protein
LKDEKMKIAEKLKAEKEEALRVKKEKDITDSIQA